jgi:chromosome segregation ATPase
MPGHKTRLLNSDKKEITKNSSTDLATLNEQIIDAKTARHDADGHKNAFKRLDQTARAIGRLGDELVSHRDQQRVSRQTQKLRQGFQALSDKIDMKVKELVEMGNELQQLQEKINNANSEAEVATRVLKEVSRAARADKNLLEERRDRLKLSQTEIKRAEREIKESGEKAALKVLSKCGEENARAVREKLANAQRRTEEVVEDIEKEERKLSRMIELLCDFESHADHLENEIQTLQNPKACEVKLGNLREAASHLLDCGNFSDHSPVTLRLDRLNRMLTNASEQSRERRNALENEKRRETEREREFENVKKDLGQFDVVSIESLADLPADLNKLDNLITKWENLEPKLEYLESTSESPIMQPGSTASLRRRSRTRRQGGTLPRNSGRLSGPSASGVEGLRLKYESIGDRLINTRNVGQILLEQLEVWHSNQVKAEHIMKNLADSSSLISAMGDVAEAVRSGKAVITTCRTKLDSEPKDLPKLEKEVDQLQKQFNEAQQKIMDARLSKDQKSKDIDHWQQRFLNLSDWTSDQWSLMSVLGKISADPAILEPQRQQVDALLSEFNSRKERYNQLQADCLALNDTSKSQDMKQLSSRWNELEQKLEERKIAIDEALQCTREIEQETAKLQDFLTTVTADIAISSRLPPAPDSVEDCLKKLRRHQTCVPEMEKSAKLAQQAAEFLAQVAAGAENHGNKSHSVGQALFISTKKLDEKIGTLTELLVNIDEAYKLRSGLFNSINCIEKAATYGREEVNALRSKYDELVALVEDISENTSPIRNNSLREDKRAIQRKIKALETGLDQRERDESRRARKQAQLLSFINDREQQIASTHEGEAQPDAIHQKITLVQTLKDELNARMGELKAQFGGPTDSKVQQSFNSLLEKSTDRAKELQDAKLQAEELDGLLHDFNEWAEDSLEKILAATNFKSPETLYEMQVCEKIICNSVTL